MLLLFHLQYTQFQHDRENDRQRQKLSYNLSVSINEQKTFKMVLERSAKLRIMSYCFRLPIISYVLFRFSICFVV